MENVYNPPAAPANITDLATGTRNLDKEGLDVFKIKSYDLKVSNLLRRNQ